MPVGSSIDNSTNSISKSSESVNTKFQDRVYKSSIDAQISSLNDELAKLSNHEGNIIPLSERFNEGNEGLIAELEGSIQELEYELANMGDDAYDNDFAEFLREGIAEKQKTIENLRVQRFGQWTLPIQ